MGDKTGIEWTDATWNPTTGCDQVSPGCDNCYALTQAKRLKAMGQPKYQRDGNPTTSGPGFGFTEHDDARTLEQPLRWARARRIFVNSMSDLFHGDATTEHIARVWAVMALTPRHTYQVLTKRPAIMRAKLSDELFRTAVLDAAYEMWRPGCPEPYLSSAAYLAERAPWPLPNVWLGTSVENQRWANLRIPALLDTPAAVRFLSCEPLLGPVDLTEPLARWAAGRAVQINQHLHWLIVGGESGPRARPMSPHWARSLRDQCQDAGVAFHFKQWGEWAMGEGDDQPGDVRLPTELGGSTYYLMRRLGKHTAGRELDGRTWDEFPELVTA